jgi:hypothetical protein
MDEAMTLRPMVRAALASAVSLAACKVGDSDRSDRAAAIEAAQRADAATVPPIDAGITAVPTFDPSSGFHLDDTPVARPGSRIAARDRKPVQLLLRSSPPGAIAAVDGTRLGPTPVLWDGVTDGLRHEFTFVMAGHALARYSFVPVTSGIVHGTLVKLTDDQDAGLPRIPGESIDAGAGAAANREPPPRMIDAAPPPPSPVDAGGQDGL